MINCFLNVKLFLFYLLIGILTACGSDVRVDNEILGFTLEKVNKKYGPPLRDTTINVTNATVLYEYQSNLYNKLADSMESDTVLIKELFWQNANGDKTVVWLQNKNGSWVVIDNLIWSKRIRF